MEITKVLKYDNIFKKYDMTLPSGKTLRTQVLPRSKRWRNVKLYLMDKDMNVEDLYCLDTIVASKFKEVKLCYEDIY